LLRVATVIQKKGLAISRGPTHSRPWGGVSVRVGVRAYESPE